MNNYCIIMAGGIGSRFWPLSKDNYPKQFLDILGTGKSFIRSTYERFSPVIPDENFLVVTNKAYKHLVLEHLPMMSRNCLGHWGVDMGQKRLPMPPAIITRWFAI